MMATYRVHAIMVIAHEADELPHGTLWGVISDADLMQAARTADLRNDALRVRAVQSQRSGAHAPGGRRSEVSRVGS